MKISPQNAIAGGQTRRVCNLPWLTGKAKNIYIKKKYKDEIQERQSYGETEEPCQDRLNGESSHRRSKSQPEEYH